MIAVERPIINIPATKVFLETWEAVTSKLYKLIVQEGSSRSSKTWSDFQVLFKYGYERPNKVITVLRDTAIDCRDIVETEWVKWLSDPMNRVKQLENEEISFDQYIKYLKSEDLKKLFIENKTKHVWTFKHNGANIRFTGLDDEDKVMGMTQNVCLINEPYNFPHEIYRQLSQRTSDFIIADWNPKKAHWLEDEKKKSNTIVLKSTFKDNPFCPEESKKQILSYQPVRQCQIVTQKLLTEQEAKVYDILANKNGFSPYQIKELARCRENENTNSASEFHWMVYGLGLKAERPNRIFNWSEISLDEYLSLDTPIYSYSDWGAVDPWAVGDVKYYDGALYVRERNYTSENVLRSNLAATELSQIAGINEGIVSWMFGKLGIPYDRNIICDTNRPAKILALRAAGWEYAVGLKARETGASKSAVVDGIDLLNNLKVYYTSDSPNIKYEQENYSRDVDRYGVVLETPVDIDNHHCDGIRYTCLYLQAKGVINIV